MPPHSKQSFLMRMILWSSSGVDAVFSLYTGKRQVVVYLSAPSSFSERTNQIGVAITKEGYYNKVQQYFDKMKEHDLGDMFEAWSIKRFADSSKPLVVRAGNLTVTASMGAEHITSAIIKIS
ncbi:hypothetical protein Tcan_18302 [Toxocara canis]|nr:hypothetical protein Tcan_18302 [Toxocara canis]